MKDAIGNELSIGDWVAIIAMYSKVLKAGKIIKFTPKMCEVEFKKGYPTKQLRASYQVVKLGYKPEER